MKNPWTAEAIERLRALYASGASASQIAKALADDRLASVTRNAVIGKVHRLGLEKRGRNGNYNGSGRPRKPREPKERVSTRTGLPIVPRGEYLRGITSKAIAPEPFVVRAVEVAPLHIDFLALTHNTCRYPFGEGPFTFCGHHAANSPYCEAHTQLTSAAPTWRKLTPEHKAALRRGRQRTYARASA